MTEKKGEAIAAIIITAIGSFWFGMNFMALYHQYKAEPAATTAAATISNNPHTQYSATGPDSIAQAWLNGMADISVKADTIYGGLMVYYTVDANHLRLQIHHFLPQPFEQAEYWEFYAHDVTGKTVFSHITVQDTNIHHKIYNLTKYHKP